MNLGFYLKTTKDYEQFSYCLKLIEEAKNNNLLKDASIFYDDISYIPNNQQICGLFNSTELWNFSGNLITFSLENLVSAYNIANRIKIHYFYGWKDDMNFLDKLIVLNQFSPKIFCIHEKHQKEFYRITGKKIPNHKSLQSILDYLK